MDSHAIRCFQQVFEKESIHQAAKDLCMTPQGVSRVIRALEGEMQTALFIRSRKGMKATPEGRYFYEHTQELTRQLLDLQLGMQALKRKKAGLHIGFSCGVLNILSIHVLKGVMARHPDKSLEWVEDFNEKIIQLIAEDSLSCGFCISPIRSDAFFQEEIYRTGERAATATRRCTVNPLIPLIGRELDGTEIQPAPVKKKVLVVGAGPGGLYVAYTAARRGHQVILCEKESEVGGILKSEQAIPFKREMYELGKTYERLARQAGVEIRLNTEVTPAYAAKEKPQALIIAAESCPFVPPIKGLDGDNVIIVNQYYKEKAKVGNHVIVFGGGLAGCECAIHLGQEGKEVELIEMRPALAPDANVRHRPLLLAQVEKYVHVHTQYKGLEVTPEGVLCQDPQGQRILVPGDTVICALGQRSRTDVVEALRDSAPFVRVIGDAAKVSTITNAVYLGVLGCPRYLI